MRSSSILILILSISLLSCRKEHQPIPVPQQVEPEDKIIHWELRSLETIGAAYYDGMFVDSFTSVSDSIINGSFEYDDSTCILDFNCNTNMSLSNRSDMVEINYSRTIVSDYIKTDSSFIFKFIHFPFSEEHSIIHETDSSLKLSSSYSISRHADSEGESLEKGIMYLTFGK